MAMWICLLFITVLGAAAEDAEEPHHNFIAQFVYDTEHSCNGIPIKSDADGTYILTASHCTISYVGFAQPNRLYCGDYNTRPQDTGESTYLTWDVVHYYSHPPVQAQPVSEPNLCVGTQCFWPEDIAVMRVDTECNIGEQIPPVYEGSIDELIQGGYPCWAMGWLQSSSDIKKVRVDITLYTDDLPSPLSPPFPKCLIDFNGKLPRHVVCTDTNSGVCLEKGMSGGPLVCKHDGEFKLVGIVSTMSGDCSEATHTVIESFLGEIIDEIGPLTKK